MKETLMKKNSTVILSTVFLFLAFANVAFAQKIIPPVKGVFLLYADLWIWSRGASIKNKYLLWINIKDNEIIFFIEINYNKETNDQIILTNLKFTQDLLNKEASISHIYIQTEPSSENEQVKTEIKDLLGESFVVKTNAEKNELIYKTSKSEKLIVIAILFFIFLLASFNLVASITMLFIEKKDNLIVLQTLGLNERKVFSIFFY